MTFSVMTTPILVSAVLVAGCDRREERAIHDAPTQGTVSAAPAAEPLPASALRVKWGAATIPPRVAPGGTTLVSVTFTNIGDKPWPDKDAGDPSKRDGAHAVRLGYAWSRASEPDSPRDRRPERADLPHSIKPGESVTLDMSVVAPEAPGDYLLNFDLVQELLFWFSDRGADTLTIPIQVQAGGATENPTRSP